MKSTVSQIIKQEMFVNFSNFFFSYLNHFLLQFVIAIEVVDIIIISGFKLTFKNYVSLLRAGR